jgi:hypothetical protein
MAKLMRYNYCVLAITTSHASQSSYYLHLNRTIFLCEIKSQADDFYELFGLVATDLNFMHETGI